MGVQKRRASDNDIINYQEKKEVRVAGLRKGRRKKFGRTRARVRGRNKQVFLSLFSRDRIENLFPFRKTAMRAKEKTANVLESLSAHLFAKKLCEHVSMFYPIPDSSVL